jgi:hypothetical protein
MATITAAAVTPINAGNGTTTGSSYNTTPAYSGTFIPTIWSGKLIAKFYEASTFAAIANTDYQGEISGLGDKVIMNTIPDIAISNYTIGSNLTYPTPVPQSLELLIDKAKSFAYPLHPVLEKQSKIDLASAFANDAAEKMKAQMDKDNWVNTLVDFLAMSSGAANRGATAGAKSASYNLGTDLAPLTLTTSNVLPTILALASALDEQNIPPSDRALVIDPVTRLLLMQSPLAQAQFMGDAKSMVRNGLIGGIDRFSVYVSNQLPTAAAGQNFLGGVQASALKRRAIIACHKSAITFATQLTENETVPNPNDFGKLVRGLQVWGAKVVKAEAYALALVA